VRASQILMRERRSFRSLGSMSLAEKRQKTLDPPSTSCSTLSLAIKLRTGRGQRESGSQPASERESEREALYFCLFISPFVLGLQQPSEQRTPLFPAPITAGAEVESEN
jgi:hypothetical protein